MKALKDKFGRVHDYLRLSLIDKCNLRCTYCMPEDMHFFHKSQIMSLKEIKYFSSLFVNEFGINKIRLTGGEPLIRQDIEEILLFLKTLNIQLNITTNGIYLQKYIDVIKESGIKSVNISLDTLEHERFFKINRREGLAQVKEGIEAALKNDLHVKLNMVVLKNENECEVSSFVELTKHENIHVRFIEFMPFNDNTWQLDQVVPYKTMLEDLSVLFDIEKLDDEVHSTTKKFKVKGYKGTFAFITTMTAPFCSDCNRIRLTADGKLKNCLFSNREMDLLSAHRNGSDVKALIVEEIQMKKAQLGGMDTFMKSELERENFNSRCMTSIGG